MILSKRLNCESIRLRRPGWFQSDNFLGANKFKVLALTQSIVLLSLVLGTSHSAKARVVSPKYSPTIHCSWALADDPGSSDSRRGNVGNADNAGDAKSIVVERKPTDTPATDSAEFDEAGRQEVCFGDPVRLAPQGGKPPVLVQLKGADSGERNVELFAAVSYPSSDAFGPDQFENEGRESAIGRLSWTVKGPDGASFGRVTNPTPSCGGTEKPGPMWREAAHPEREGKRDDPSRRGLFSMDVVTNASGTGLWQACRQGQVRVFVGRITIPSDAKCGNYSVSTIASVDGETSTSIYDISVECPISVKLDFEQVRWSVEPGATAVVDGDLNPLTSNRPTVTNLGRGPVQVGVVFSALRRSDLSDSIAEFGVMLVPKIGPRTGISRLPADEEGWIPGPSSVVCPGESVQLNLVVHAPAKLSVGDYSGEVRVIARSSEPLEDGPC
jgi:hypothetical protein